MYLNNNELDLKVKVLIETENYMELIKLALALEIHEDQYSFEIKKNIIHKILTVHPSTVKESIPQGDHIWQQFLLLLNPTDSDHSPLQLDWLRALTQKYYTEEYVLDKNSTLAHMLFLTQWIQHTNAWTRTNNEFPFFLFDYLNTDWELNDSKMFNYYETINQICALNDPVIFQSIFQPKKENSNLSNIVRHLLKTEENIQPNHVKNAICYLLEHYKDDHEKSFPLIFIYFFKRKNNTTLEQKELSFFKENLFTLLRCYNEQKNGHNRYRSPAFNKFLIEALSKKSFSTSEEMTHILLFIQLHRIKDPQFIHEVSKKSMQLEPSEGIIKFLVELAIINSDLAVLRELLNRYSRELLLPLANKFLEKKRTIDPRVIGFLYAYKNEILPEYSVLDFLVTDYYDYCYHIWNITENAAQDILLEVNTGVESSMNPEGSKKIHASAIKKFPEIDPAKSYRECIEYIANQLQKLEGNMHALENPEARKSFLPEAPIVEAIPPADQAQAIPPVDQAQAIPPADQAQAIPPADQAQAIPPADEAQAIPPADEAQAIPPADEAQAIPPVDQAVEAMVPAEKIMTEEQKQTALYHTALRLLMHDENAGLDPYFEGFETAVGYCYELAKRVNCLDIFIQQDLVYIRRAHNLDTLKRRQEAADYSSCPPGTQGRLYQFYAFAYNNIIATENQLKKFSIVSINNEIKSLVIQNLSEMTRNFLRDDSYQLTQIIYYYQASASMILDESDLKVAKVNAEKAINYILENKIDYLKLYRKLVRLYTERPISECPNEIKERLKDLIAYQFRVVLLHEEPQKDYYENIAFWETFPNEVIHKIYPLILLHFLDASLPQDASALLAKNPEEKQENKSKNSVADSLDFNKLAEMVIYMPLPVLEPFRTEITNNLSHLAYLSVKEHSEQKIYRFMENIRALKNSGILPNENIINFFRLFVGIVKDDESFDIKTILLLKAAIADPNDILQRPLPFNIFEQLIVSINHSQYCKLHNFISYTINNGLLTKDSLVSIMSQQAEQLIADGNYTAYLRLIRFALSFNIFIKHQDSAFVKRKLTLPNTPNSLLDKTILYDAQQNETFIDSIENKATSQYAFSDLENTYNINELEAEYANLNRYACYQDDIEFYTKIHNFIVLKKASAKGNAYASFAVARLYKDKLDSVPKNFRPTRGNKQLIVIYSTIALQQALDMDDEISAKKIQAFCKKNNFILPCFEEMYYSHILELMNSKPDTEDFNTKLRNFLLLAVSIDLSPVLLESTYESKNKQNAMRIVEECLSGKDLSKIDAVLRIYDKLWMKGCYIQSKDGALDSSDPRILLPKLLFQQQYQAVKLALITIEETSKPQKSAIDTKALCKQLAKQLKVKEMTISRYLNHIYKHISIDPLYQKDLEGLGTSEEEKIVTTLTAICRHSNISLEIFSIADPSPVSNNHRKVNAKDKEATRLKIKSIKSDEKMFQDAVCAVFQRLPNGQDVVTSIDIIKELRFKHGISIPAAIRLIGNVYAHKVPAKSSTAQPNNNIYRLYPSQQVSLEQQLEILLKPLKIQLIAGASLPESEEIQNNDIRPDF